MKVYRIQKGDRPEFWFTGWCASFRRRGYAIATSWTWSSSFASTRYCSDAGFLGRYSMPGSPLLGASAFRTALGITDFRTLLPKFWLTYCMTRRDDAVLRSYVFSMFPLPIDACNRDLITYIT